MKKYIFNTLGILLVLFQLQDFYCTYIGISEFGTDIEANILIKYLIDVFGLDVGLAIPKMIAVLLVYYIYEIGIEIRYKCSILVLMLLLNIFYGWVGYQWICLLLERNLL